MSIRKKWRKLITPRILTLLIACYGSFTALAQKDSTYCFTHNQVQQFLRTKVELINCENNYEIIVVKNQELKETNKQITQDLEDKKTRLKRTRKIMLGSWGVGALFVVLFLLK